nr:YHS domain-containing protein [Cellulomonas sp. 73-92]
MPHHHNRPTDDTRVVDPVCRMKVDPATAPASRRHEATIFYFCSTGCAAAFEVDPRRYVHQLPA